MSKTRKHRQLEKRLERMEAETKAEYRSMREELEYIFFEWKAVEEKKDRQKKQKEREKQWKHL